MNTRCRLLPLLLLSALLLASAGCQSPAPPDTPARAAPPVPAAPQVAVRTAAQARATVARFVLTLPHPEQYAPDSARVRDLGGSWQVLVPRTAAGRRVLAPARFSVSKTTGFVRAGEGR